MKRPVIGVLAATGLMALGAVGVAFDRQLSRALVEPVSVATTTTVGRPAEAPDLAFEPVAVPAVLRLALARPASWRPDELVLTDQSAVIVSGLLYQGLTRSDGGHLGPGLARTWSSEGDFTRWRFDLADDRVPAATVAAGLRHLVASPPGPAVASMLAGVQRVEATGPSTVEITLGRPNAGLPWLLASPALAVAGEGGSATGDYTIATQDDHGLTLAPRATGTAAGTGAGAGAGTAAGAARRPERIEITWAAGPGDAYRALTLGQADAAVARSDDLSDARTRFGWEPAARSITRFYGLNPRSAALADDRVRRAVLAAVDRDRLARATTVGGAAVVADGLTAAGVAGYQAGLCGGACRPDPVTAARLVNEVSTATGHPVALTVAYTGADQSRVAQALVDQLRPVGIQVTLVQQTPEELAATMAGDGADLFAYGWVAGAGSADAVVPALLHSGSPANGLGLDLGAVDQLIDQAARTGDDQARWALLGQAEAAVLSRYQVLPVSDVPSYLVTAPQAAGIRVRADGSLEFPPGQ